MPEGVITGTRMGGDAVLASKRDNVTIYGLLLYFQHGRLRFWTMPPWLRLQWLSLYQDIKTAANALFWDSSPACRVDMG